MPNILLTRIDNRLVHGQVGVTWTKTLGANLIVVADDTAAEDRIQQSLMSVTAKSSGVGIRFFRIEKQLPSSARQHRNRKSFIVCRTPKDVRRLVEAGVALKEVNVGNMHFSEGKRALTKKVYVDDEDMDDLKYLVSKGINVYAQDVPEIQNPQLNNKTEKEMKVIWRLHFYRELTDHYDDYRRS